jgi:hypothetical protein
VQVLESLAALASDGGYLGALSIPGTSREAALYRHAVADATRGAFGDVQFTRRTSGSTLFVNPLMAIYFTVDLATLAARCLYLDRIEDTIGPTNRTHPLILQLWPPLLATYPYFSGATTARSPRSDGRLEDLERGARSQLRHIASGGRAYRSVPRRPFGGGPFRAETGQAAAQWACFRIRSTGGEVDGGRPRDLVERAGVASR